MGSAPKQDAMASTPTPKTMSSRLMTMKFMQRAAASAPSSPSTPTADSDGSAKRRKMSHSSTAAISPQTALYDQKAIQAALEAEEKKRQAAVEKRAQELGDSHWVLSGSIPQSNTVSKTTLNVVQVGFAQIDSSGSPGGQDQNLNPAPKGNFLRFNMKKLSKQAKMQDDQSSSDSDDDESDDESDSSQSPPTRNQPERGRQTTLDAEGRKRARDSFSSSRLQNERKKAKEFAEKRRSKEIKSSKLMSISAASGYKASGGATATGPCYSCGKPGHMSKDCSAPKRRK